MTSEELSHRSFGEYLLSKGRLLDLRLKVSLKKLRKHRVKEGRIKRCMWACKSRNKICHKSDIDCILNKV